MSEALYMDPHFIQAFKSPNYQELLQKYQALEKESETNKKDNTVFEGNTNPQETATPKEEESSSAAGWVAGAIGAAALITGGVLCYKKGNGKGLEKILDGAKQYLKKGKDKASTALKSKPKEEFTVQKIGDEYVCTVPGKKQIIRKTVRETDTGNVIKDDIAANAPKLGITSNIPALGSEGTKIVSYRFECNGHTISVRNGQIRGIIDPQGNRIDIAKITNPVEQAEKDLANEINKIIGAVKEKKQDGLDRIKDVIYQQSENGTTRTFVDKATDPQRNGLRRIETNRFGINDPTVGQYRLHNETLDKTLTKLATDGNKDGLKIVSAKRDVPGIGTMIIENGEITGVIKNGTLHKKGSTIFDDLQYRNKETFENVLKRTEDYTDIVYQAA